MSNIISIRASSMPGLFDCAYRWEAQQILKMRNPASVAMIIGSAVHAGGAVFDAARMAGKPIKPDEAAAAVVKKLKNPGEDVQRTLDDPTPKEAEAIALTLHSKYCTLISPRYTFSEIELKLDDLDIDVPSEGVTVRLTGSLDRSRIVTPWRLDSYGSTPRKRIVDLKTGARAAYKPKGSKELVAETKGHGLQLGVYQLLAQMRTGEPIDERGEIVGLSTATGAVAVSEIRAPMSQVLGGEGTPSLIEISANMFKTGLFPPNPKSILCGKKYCPRWNACPYHE